MSQVFSLSLSYTTPTIQTYIYMTNYDLIMTSYMKVKFFILANFLKLKGFDHG